MLLITSYCNSFFSEASSPYPNLSAYESASIK